MNLNVIQLWGTNNWLVIDWSNVGGPKRVQSLRHYGGPTPSEFSCRLHDFGRQLPAVQSRRNGRQYISNAADIFWNRHRILEECISSRWALFDVSDNYQISFFFSFFFWTALSYFQLLKVLKWLMIVLFTFGIRAGKTEEMTSPSARLILGMPVRVGTGSFGVFNKLYWIMFSVLYAMLPACALYMFLCREFNRTYK